MKQQFQQLICLLFFLPAAFADPVTVLVPPDVWKDYQTLVNGRDPLTITEFSGPGRRRDVVEVILLQQALERPMPSSNLSLRLKPITPRL